MTTLSGTADFQLSRNELVSAVLRGMSVIGHGESPESEDFTNIAQALNLIIKAWHTMGLQLWTVSEFSLTPVVDRLSYTLGPGGGDTVSVTITDGGSGYVAPIVTFSAPTGAGGVTALGTVQSSGGVVTGVTITTTGTNYTSPPTVTITGAPGTGTTAICNLNGRFMRRPLRLLDDAFLRRVSGGNDSPLTQIDRISYQRLGLKTNASQPNEFYYDPQLDNGVLFIHPVASSATSYTLHFSSQSPLQDINLSTENVDFPQEWFQALKWGVIDEIGLEYGMSENMMTRAEKKSNFYRTALSEWDGAQDNTPVFFQVGIEGNSGRGGGGR